MLNVAIFPSPLSFPSTRISTLLALLAGLFLLPAGAIAQQSTSSYTFSAEAIGKSATETLTLTIPSFKTLAEIAVLTQGAANLDFTNAGGGTCKVGTAYAAKATCTVSVTFAPKLAGTRYGAVVLTASNGEVIATDYLEGTGTGPQVNFLPGTEIVVADSGLDAPANMAVDGSGNLYFGNADNTEVMKATLSGGSYTLSTLFTGLTNIGALAVDGAGNVYIVDTSHLLKETWNGSSFVQSSVGSGFSYPAGVAVDGVGNLYVADTNNNRILMETLSAGSYTQSTVPDSAAPPGVPTGIAVDGSGNIYIAWDEYDGEYGGLTKLTPSSGGYTQSSIGSGLDTLSGITIDGRGDLYVSYIYSPAVIKETPTASGYVQSTVTDSITGSSYINPPRAAGVDGNGNLYINDTDHNRVLKEDLWDAPSLSFASTGVGTSSPDSPKTEQVFNFGNENLTFKGLSYPADFPEARGDASACTGATVLKAGLLCDLPIDFTPGVLGSPLSEEVTLTDNALNVSETQQSIAVSGTAVSDTATQFAITTTASVVAGSPFTIKIAALTVVGTPAVGYNGTVGFSSSDPLFVNPGTLTLVGGLGQTTVTLKTAGIQTITATDTTTSTLTSAGSFTVAGAVAVGVQISNVQSVAYVSGAFPFTVTAFDVYGNATTAQVKFSSTDPGAILPGTSTLPGGPRIFAAALVTLGKQTITVTDTANNSINATSGPITVLTPNLVVTTAADDAGVTGHCTVQTATTRGTDAACSLRDALLASAAFGAGIIGFDTTKFAAPQTITLGSAGTLTIPTNTSIAGPTTGAGATLTNLLTVNGAGQYTVFTVPSSTAAATLNDLTISNGASPGVGGGGINNQGSITVNNSTFSGNTANGGQGGAIYNNNFLGVNNSTFVGNTANLAGGAGGAIFTNSGNYVFVNDSTFTGNQSTCGGAVSVGSSDINTFFSDDTITGNTGGCAGGIYGVLCCGPGDIQYNINTANTIVSGNTAPDISGDWNPFGGEVVGVGNPGLAPLGYYGGPTQTMAPLPGSPAICAGLGINQGTPYGGDSAGPDQRGFPLDQLCSGGPGWFVDSGAVETNYAIAFTTEPPSSFPVGLALLPAPVVQITESGVVAAIPTNTVSMTDSAGFLGGTTAANFASGSATFGNLVVSAPASNDLLTATLSVGYAANLTAQSSPIQVNGLAADTLYIPAPGSLLAGPSVTFTWTPLSGATGYSLWIGTAGVGTDNVYDSHETTATSVTVSGLPTNGATLYVQLNTTSGKTTVHGDYLYTAATGVTITTQPVSQTVPEGSAATFSVVATGAPTLTYAWQYLSGSTWKPFAAGTGYNTSTLTTVATTPAFNGLKFRVVVTDGQGLTATSNTVTLTVTGPVITSQPVSQSVAAGSTATFNMTATGTPTLTYVWQYLSGSTWKPFAAGTGYNSPKLTTVATTPAFNGLQFRVVVTDGNGVSAASNTATLTVTN